jgi:hypothetical protein
MTTGQLQNGRRTQISLSATIAQNHSQYFKDTTTVARVETVYAASVR